MEQPIEGVDVELTVNSIYAGRKAGTMKASVVGDNGGTDFFDKIEFSFELPDSYAPVLYLGRKLRLSLIPLAPEPPVTQPLTPS